MPVMEGKAMLFKEFAGVDALPICLDTKDADEIVAIVQGDRARLRRHQPRGHRRPALLRGRGAAAQASSTSPSSTTTSTAPRWWCWPALLNALKLVEQEDGRAARWWWSAWARPASPSPRCCCGRASPTSSAATARASLVRRARRAWTGSRSGSPSTPTRAASSGTAARRWPGADVFIGLSGPGAVSVEAICAMAATRSCSPWPTRRRRSRRRRSRAHVRVIATGRSDYPNQINNVLCFPGIFRGALDVARDHRSTRR